VRPANAAHAPGTLRSVDRQLQPSRRSSAGRQRDPSPDDAAKAPAEAVDIPQAASAAEASAAAAAAAGGGGGAEGDGGGEGDRWLREFLATVGVRAKQDLVMMTVRARIRTRAGPRRLANLISKRCLRVCDMRTHGSILGTMQEVQYSPVICTALHCTLQIDDARG
jgi:hypothetical protein